MADDNAPLKPGATIGILGGGQLGLMLAAAALPLGLKTHVYAPDAEAPAAMAATAHTRGAYEDETALAAFAAACDVVTYEFENVPAATASFLESRTRVRPRPRVLDIAQDRLSEKDSMRKLGLATAPFGRANDENEARVVFAALNAKAAIVKTRRMGYDGKGQARVSTADEAAEAVTRFGVPCILEGVIAFEREVAVVVARGVDGRIEAFEPVETQHRDGILARAMAPARLSPAVAAEAWRIAGTIVEALDYVGVMGVELFLARKGMLLVNEIAPRVHNSGHWTMDGCYVSQFEQHIRAVAGWPLRPAVRHSDCVMENLVGEDIAAVPQIAQEPNAAIHLYGKSEVRPGRKMGHVNRLYPAGGRP